MGSIVFLVTGSPYTWHGSNTLVSLAATALDKGHEVLGIFFFVDGVYNVARDATIEEGMLEIKTSLQALIARGVPVMICSACADYRGITPAGAIDGVEFAGIGSFAEIVESADRVISFGVA